MAEGTGPMIGTTGRSANFFGSKDGKRGKTIKELLHLGYTQAEIDVIKRKVEETGRKLPAEPEPASLAKEYAILVSDGEAWTVKEVVNSLPSGKMGENYNIHFAIDGGYLPVLFVREASKIPLGLSLNGRGMMTGVLAESGLVSVSLVLRDNLGNETTSSFTISVEPEAPQAIESVVAEPELSRFGIPEASSGDGKAKGSKSKELTKE